MNYFSSVKINFGEADFRLLDRKVVDNINALPERPKFYRGIVHWLGYEIGYVRYKPGKREHGHSSYSVSKMLYLARAGLTSFSLKPLEAIIAIGFFIFFVFSLILLVTLFVKFFIDYSLFSNSFILVMLIMVTTGLLISFQGIIAIYLVDIFNAALGRPSYVVHKTIGFKNTEDEKL